MATGADISIITLNVNGVSAPNKRHRLAEWIQKQDPYICCLQKTPLGSQRIRHDWATDLKTHTEWKWENGKIYSMHMGSKKKLE